VISRRKRSKGGTIDILHIDIETAPNLAHVFGLWKQNIGLSQIVQTGYTLCWSAKWHGRPGLMYSSIHKDGEKKMLAKVHKLLDKADAVCHYNGTKFDIPILNKEFLKAGMPPPDPYHQIDLLKTARKRFRFESNKLDHLAKSLGLGAKVKHKGHELWVGCMNGDDQAWRQMERYNKQDVVLLEKLYLRMLPWIQQHPNHGLYTESDRPVCPNCGSERVIKKGRETTLLMTYQRYRCAKCHTPIRGRRNIMRAEDRQQVLTQSKI
jgi:DNA polymerase elongation subunit (family B)